MPSTNIRTLAASAENELLNQPEHITAALEYYVFLILLITFPLDYSII